jgi:hypothetical protein
VVVAARWRASDTRIPAGSAYSPYPMQRRSDGQEDATMSVIKKFLVTCAATAGLGLVLAVPAQAGPVGQYPADGDGAPGVSAPVLSDPLVSNDAAGEDGLQLEGVEEPAVSTFAASGVKYGGTIKRADVIKRADNWYKRNVQYSQTAYAWDVNKGKKYRTDCSGFVSMSLALTSSRTTRTLDGVATKIAWKNLKAGDFVLRKGHHVVLFHKWANSAHTKFWIYEEASTKNDMNHRTVTVSERKSSGYVPYRYKKIK